MSPDDQEIFRSFLEESQEHLATIEEDIVELETQGDTIDEQLINKVFRAVHTLKGSAGFFSLQNIKDLAHVMENILGKIRSHEMICTSQCTTLLLEGADLLKSMLDDTDASASYDIKPLINRISTLVPSNNTLVNNKNSLPDKSIPSGTVSNSLFTKDQIVILQKQDKAGQYVYILEWQLDTQTKATSLQPTIMEISQYGAIAQPHIEINPGNDYFTKKVTISFLYSTVVEPELFYDLVSIPKSSITLLNHTDKTDSPQMIPQSETKDVVVPSSESQHSEKQVSKANQSRGKIENSSIRVNLDQLDRLMILAGELVLARNALLR